MQGPSPILYQGADRTGIRPGKEQCRPGSLRIHGEETLKGHLMLTFLSSILFQLLQQDMLLHTQKKDKINPEGSFLVLRNQKCKVFDKAVIPQEPTKKMNDIYKLLDIESPVSIPY